jgi:threonine dehydrogenase-like Zn-dependent dehydrogenase
MNRSVTIKTGHTHVHRYLEPLLKLVQSGEVDPSFVITHRLKLEDAPEAYRIFRDKEDECIKVVLRP